MKDWFQALAPRERAFIVAAVLVAVIAVAWVGLWQPLDKRHQEVAERVATWNQGIAELRPLKGQISTAAQSSNVAQSLNQSLVVIVDNSLRQRGLYNALQRSQPTPAGDGIRVEFESAAFDDLMLWLGDLHRQYGLDVESGSFSIASGENPGRVNSSVTLRR
jgi:general secretion pathway protein M